MIELTRKQQKSVLNLLKGMTQRDAYIAAGYSPKSALSTIDANASRLANSDKVSVRLKELQEKAVDETVASVLERKQATSTIIRTEMRAPVTAKEKVIAITELNKMEHVYDEKSQYNDNRQLNIIVQSEDAREKLNMMLSGARHGSLIKSDEQPQDIDTEGEG